MVAQGQPSHCTTMSACPYAGQKNGEHVHFKIIDYGHAIMSSRKVARRLPKVPVFEKFYQRQVKAD